jgi:hypothetical protein
LIFINLPVITGKFSPFTENLLLPLNRTIITIGKWLGTVSGGRLVDLTSECMIKLEGNHTDACIAHLLDGSVRHGPNFDWVVAHIGGCFPEIVITRVLSVGLKSHQEMAKVNSVVGILGHLGSTHKPEIKACIYKMLVNSEDPLVIPFLLNLATLSSLMASTMMSVAAEVMNMDMVIKVSDLVPVWMKHDIYDNKEGGLVNLAVNLLIKHGTFGLVKNLLDFSSDNVAPNKDILQGCRQVLDQLLVELHTFVHGPGHSKKEDNSVIKEASLHWISLMDNYLFNGDIYQRKAVSLLLNCIFLQEGRTLTSMAFQVFYDSQIAESLQCR